MIDKSKLPPCPVQTTLLFISDKWKILVIRDLLGGTKRFSELKRSLAPVTQKMLTQQLRSMEEDGLIARKVYPVVPPKVEYSLTELGRSLSPVLDSMKEWGLGYKSHIN
jgi:DNA-binding HxlR family transcriptional regulator